MADAERLAADQRPELQVERRREGERALRADEQVGHVDRSVGLAATGDERVEVVAADAPLHGGEARLDLARLARAEREQVGEERSARIVRRHVGEVGLLRPETRRGAVGEHGVHRQHVVAHGAVAQRAAAAGIVAGHAADRGARGRGHVDGEPQAVRLEAAVEVVEDDARFDAAGARLRVERQHAVEVLGAVDDHRLVHVCPHWDVPPPRGSTATPCDLAMPIADSASAIVVGTTAPSGIIW